MNSVLDIFPGAPYLLAGKWSYITENMDILEQDLEYTDGNVTNFDYTYSINNTNQKIAVTIDCKVEAYDWDSDNPYMNGSVIYNYHKEITIEFKNYILKRFNIREEYTVDSLVNETYLEENDKIIYLDSKSSTSMGQDLTDVDRELTALFGISCISVAAIFWVAKRKKFFN